MLTFESGGAARGRGNGNATIIGTHQGLQATRLIHVATDYQGTWLGDYVVRRCEESGDFRATDCLDREDGFYVGELLEIMLDLQQDRDEVTGNLALGGLDGTTRGRVESDGQVAVGTGSTTFTEDGISVVFALDPLNVIADGDRMIGAFTVTVTATGASGQGVLQAELKTVVQNRVGCSAARRELRASSAASETCSSKMRLTR